jgi:thiol-disulfide isomerase/thioredoxin
MVVAAIAVAAIAPLGGTGPVVAQDVPDECASALWLEPLTAAQGTEDDVAEITEPTPAWMTAELTDACSGETFALADFAGKTLYVEPMATWCVNCREQLARTGDAFAQLAEAERSDVVLLALSSEVGLPREDLAAYAEASELPFIFAVMSEEMLKAMADDLGQEIAVPPATPHLIVAPDGTVGELRTGGASVEDLLALFAGGDDAAS